MTRLRMNCGHFSHEKFIFLMNDLFCANIFVTVILTEHRYLLMTHLCHKFNWVEIALECEESHFMKG